MLDQGLEPYAKAYKHLTLETELLITSTKILKEIDPMDNQKPQQPENEQLNAQAPVEDEELGLGIEEINRVAGGATAQKTMDAKCWIND
uniref:Uncharacterized protein n=1 Tax=Cyanothece sp. (strain PCC 7425 / ATCC 29141) TaxID=395961 RepID=B8HR24_CYAP4